MAFACALIGSKTPLPPARNGTHFGDTPPPPCCVRTLCMAPKPLLHYRRAHPFGLVRVYDFVFRPIILQILLNKT